MMAFLPMAGLAADTASAPQNAAEVQQIVCEASWNEMHSSGPPHSFRYRLSEQDSKGGDGKLVIETNGGVIARLVEKGGRPLSEAENKAEVARLKKLLADPQRGFGP